MFRMEYIDKMRTTHVVVKRIRALHLPQFSPHNDTMVWIVKRRVLQFFLERCYALEDDNRTTKGLLWEREHQRTPEPVIDIMAFLTKEAAMQYASWYPDAVRIAEE
jgi:hypothetical protein